MEEFVFKYLTIYIVSLITVFIMFRKMLYSIFDPAIWLVPMLASVVTFASTTNMFTYILISIFAFWMGMLTVSKNKVVRNFDETRISNVLTLKIYTYILCLIYFISLAYVFATNGIPMLSGSATEAKIAVFEGYGLLRRISFLGSIIPINLILLIILNKKDNRANILLLILYCIFKILSGSKSSIIGLIFPLAYFVTQQNTFKLRFSFKKYRKYLVGIGVVSVAVMIFVVSKEAEDEGGDLKISLIYRLMEFGDVMLYYPSDIVQHTFKDYSFINFIPDELNGISGMLRLTPYKNPLGYEMVSALNNGKTSVVYGPNTLFMIKGHIYFGIMGGVIYSYLIGVVFAAIRKYFFIMHMTDVFRYSIMAYVFFNLMGLLRESAAFYSNLFDYCFYTFPILIIAQSIVNAVGYNHTKLKSKI